MRVQILRSAAVVAALSSALSALAQHNHGAHGAAATPAAAAAPVATPTPQATDLAEGVVRRVDAAGGKITLRHGEIKHLDMPPMTMVFQVRDRALLNAVSTGAKVRFRVEQIDGAYVVTAIEPAR
jgi:Cu/Ag efflux protein CusF